MDRQRSLREFKGGDHLTNEELLGLPCTVLVPCGPIGADHGTQCLQRQMQDISGREQMVPQRWKPITFLSRTEFLSFPDILANSGGVIVSYLEWVQGAQRFNWEVTDIQDRLKDIITKAFRRTLEFAQAHHASMRMAALMNGIEQVAQAHSVRGFYP